MRATHILIFYSCLVSTADGKSSTTEDDPVSSFRRDYQKLGEKLYNSLFRDLKEQLLKELNGSNRYDLVGISMNSKHIVSNIYNKTLNKEPLNRNQLTMDITPEEIMRYVEENGVSNSVCEKLKTRRPIIIDPLD
ncbi:hypothetical protein WA026_006510 [Henosepilachna vigintioctopunctata]|uniref:Uncharacterized protein n=1 Tax=Henosepilachna vigintioctopunctata TaxID=420089 RepID=A0AAW1UH35_9CUCU